MEKRPTIKDLLKLSIIKNRQGKVEKLKRKAMKLLSRERSVKSAKSRSKSKEHNQTALLNPIKLPSNLFKLEQVLPASKYEDEEPDSIMTHRPKETPTY